MWTLAVTIAGQRYHRVLRSTATYTSAVGPVTVLRTLYRAGCEQAFVPADIIDLDAARTFLVAHLNRARMGSKKQPLGSTARSSRRRCGRKAHWNWME